MNFDDIRPYYDSEVNDALRRMTSDSYFDAAMQFLFPEKKKETIVETLHSIHSAVEFQRQFMDAAIRAIVTKTSDGLTSSGFENITPGTAYLFVANHRDILLDAAMLQVLLFAHGHITSEISFGNNLMMSPFIVDFGRVNRMFKTYRGSNPKELLENSRNMSAYIRHTLLEKKTSIWIAHRNGRTKDGNDKTQTGILKMFGMSGSKDFVSNFKELKIVPLSVSYEYEPCDNMKTQELYVSQHQTYIKKPGEDLTSILNGIAEYKGKIHLAVGKIVDLEIDELAKIKNVNERMEEFAKVLDAQIYKNYKLWPTNYIAFDLLENSSQFREKYTEEEKAKFTNHLEKRIKGLQGDVAQLRNIMLKLYANPVANCIKFQH